MPTGPTVLSLDVGTSSARAMLFDAEARPIPEAFAKVPHRPTVHPDGGASFDVEELLEKTFDTIDLVAARAPEAFSRVEGVGVSTFWHSIAGIDDTGKPTTQLLVWNDMRSAPDAARLRAEFDAEKIRQRTGCPVHAAYVPAKLRWLARTDPEAFRRSRHFLSFGELIALRLHGEPVVSPATASGSGLLDLRSGVWDPEMLQLSGVKSDQLGILVPSDYRLKKLLPEARARWKRLADVPWAPAVGDGATGNFGTSGVGEKRANRIVCMVGTSSATRATLEKPVPAPIPPGLWGYRLAPSRSLLGGSFGAGGNLVQWVSDTFKIPNVEDAESEIAWKLEKDEIGSISFLPYLAGERSPGWNDSARGTFSNVGFDARPVDFLRAALEAVAFQMADVVEALAPHVGTPEVVASGFALTKSPVWIQILADACNRPVVRSPWKEASSRGAAMLALVAAGIAGDLADIPALVAEGEPVTPSPERHRRYAEARARSKALYDALMAKR